jgi:hypothetical protein
LDDQAVALIAHDGLIPLQLELAGDAQGLMATVAKSRM